MSAGSRRGPGMVAMLVFGSALLLGLSVVGDHRRAARPLADELASVQLTDDDGGAALFAAGDLVPGATVTRCIQVRYTGPAALAEVRLLAADLAGPLAPNLSVAVSAGTGGGFASCAGFTGTAVYSGGLSALAAGTPEAPGVPAGWSPVGDGSRTYRITVQVLPGATERQSATATFRWLLVDQPAAVPPASPGPGPSRMPSPAPSASAGSNPSSGHGGGSSGAAPTHPAAPGGPLAQALHQVLHDSAVVAARVAKRSPLPAGFLTVLVLFLVAQSRIDRGDPKLAMAPMWPVPYLSFDGDGVEVES